MKDSARIEHGNLAPPASRVCQQALEQVRRGAQDGVIIKLPNARQLFGSEYK